MENKGWQKRGVSMILLLIIIVSIFVILIITMFFLDNKNYMKQTEEEYFKSSVIAYQDEIDKYVTAELKNKESNFNKKEFFVNGDQLRNVIPYIKEEDMAKFEIRKGELFYIGTDENEQEWTNEALEKE